MIKITYLLFLISFSSVCLAEHTPASLHKFIPQNYEILSQSTGDLNNDGKADLAIIIQPKNYKISDRKLLILFKQNKSDNLILTKKLPEWTYPDHENCLPDAFQEQAIKIRKQALSIIFNSMSTCSNWYGSTNTYHFKWINNDFKLIGFDYDFTQKNTGEVHYTSINYITNKRKITQTSMQLQSSKDQTKVTWQHLANLKYYTLQSIQFKPEDYFINGILKDNPTQ